MVGRLYESKPPEQLILDVDSSNSSTHGETNTVVITTLTMEKMAITRFIYLKLKRKFFLASFPHFSITLYSHQIRNKYRRNTKINHERKNIIDRCD
jgi:hypothetical protein